MNAIRVHRFGGPEVVKFEQVSDPVAGAGEVVVALKAVGVNPVETYIRAGTYGERAFPFVPGTDGAGVVEAVGAGVQSVKAGDRVYVWGTAGAAGGTYAQKCVAREDQVDLLPERLSFEQGAAIGMPYATAHYALHHRGAVSRGETVLVHGATGGVGIAAVQLARLAGAKVIASAGSEAGQTLLRRQGADWVVDHHDAGHWQQVMDFTEGRGVALIVEMLANKNLGQDLTVLAKRGRLVVVGNRGKTEIDARETMKRDADIRGMSLFNCGAEDRTAIHRSLRFGLADGSLAPVVGPTFALTDAAKAHVAVMESGRAGKVVLLAS